MGLFDFLRRQRVQVELRPAVDLPALRRGSWLLLAPTASWATAPRGPSLIVGRPQDVDTSARCEVAVEGRLPMTIALRLAPGHDLPLLAVAEGPDRWVTRALSQKPLAVRLQAAPLSFELDCVDVAAS